MGGLSSSTVSRKPASCDLLPVERERAELPRLLGRVGAPVDDAARKHAGRLVDPELAQLRPRVGGTRLEEDLGEAEHHATLSVSGARSHGRNPVAWRRVTDASQPFEVRDKSGGFVGWLALHGGPGDCGFAPPLP